MNWSAAVLFFFSSAFCSASTIHVSSSRSASALHEAVAAAKDGDTLRVGTGVYREGNLIISKSLHLVGTPNSILDGEGKFEILTISTKNFSVSGFTFRNSGYSSMNDFACIKVIDASGFVIENNNILNAAFAIHISNCSGFAIRSNTVKGFPRQEQNTGNGIHLWKCNHAAVQNNKVSGQRDGIYFEFVTDSYVENNFSEKNIRYGLHFMFSNNDTYSGNTFRNNGAGVAVMFSHHVKMYGNTFLENQGGSAYGILLKEISDGEICRNYFTSNTVGIYMEGSNRIEVSHNRFLGNGSGFRIQASCAYVHVSQNNFEANTFDVTTNGTLSLNKFESNYWDKYDGYDLNKDGTGDVPYHPVSLFSMVAEEMPYAMMFYHSLLVMLLEKSEKAIPSITPECLIDKTPLMKPVL